MTVPITLESFDHSEPHFEPESHDYKQGFEDGRADANSCIQSELRTAVAELEGTLNDMAFSYAEALQKILGKLSPLMAQIADLVVPSVLADTFQLHLIEVLQNAIREECTDSFSIHVSPKNADLFTASGLELSTPFEISPNADLIDGQAIISCGDSNQVLDLEALSTALRTALQGIDQNEWNQKNG